VPIDSRDRVATRSSVSTAPPRRAARAPAARPGPPDRRAAQRTATLRRRSRALVIGVVVMIVASAGAFVTTRMLAGGKSCAATVDGTTYRLDTDQADNARTIAAVAREVGMPNHAVTVALAAAFQESKLSNIGHGDRDSVGLFQQRPSQGWGQPAQLMTPRYAAAAFYRALAQVHGWETMSVTEAAQHVQRSAAPEAYAQWEPEARALARILTGEIPNRLVCH
jgi:hypothetical protein